MAHVFRRYDTVGTDFDHVEHPDGEWVHVDEVLALSVKLEEREKEWRAFEEREAACCHEDVGFDEYIRVLRVKLEEAQVDIYGWKQVCEGKEYQYLALTAKLEETQAERDALRADFRTLESLYNIDGVAHMTANQIEKIFDRVLHGETDTIQAASHGEIVKACPHCSALGPCMIGYAGAPSYFCAGCKAQFTEPAYYQRVKGSA